MQRDEFLTVDVDVCGGVVAAQDGGVVVHAGTSDWRCMRAFAARIPQVLEGSAAAVATLVDDHVECSPYSRGVLRSASMRTMLKAPYVATGRVVMRMPPYSALTAFSASAVPPL